MRQRIRLLGPILALAAFLAFSASDAEAQVCVGVPGTGGQNVAAASIGFPTGGNIFGAEFHHHMAGSPLTIRGRFEHINPDFGDSQNRFGAGIVYDLTGAVAAFPDELAFCFTTELMFGRFGDVNTFEIPIGVGFGSSFDLGDNGDIALIPFAVPAIYHFRVGDGGGSSTDLDMILGATAAFPAFHVGLDIQHLFRTGSSFVTLRGGFTF